MLWGPDLFASLHIELQNLRLQCEQELRGKLMKLRQSYVESALAPVDLERVLVAATASIVVLARTLLRLGGGDSAGKVDVVLEQIQARFAVPTIALRKACQLKRGHIRVAGSGTEELYCEVLSEMQGLVGVVDKLNA